jgi:hypothetical protein
LGKAGGAEDAAKDRGTLEMEAVAAANCGAMALATGRRVVKPQREGSMKLVMMLRKEGEKPTESKGGDNTRIKGAQAKGTKCKISVERIKVRNGGDFCKPPKTFFLESLGLRRGSTFGGDFSVSQCV